MFSNAKTEIIGENNCCLSNEKDCFLGRGTDVFQSIKKRFVVKARTISKNHKTDFPSSFI